MTHDYEVTVQIVKIIGIKKLDDEYKPVFVNLPLYGEHNNCPWEVNKPELSRALLNNNIPDQTHVYNELCCDELRYFLKISENNQFVKRLAACVNEPRKNDYIFYCPFCGKRIKYESKVVATFKFGKEKREVCTAKYEKVD